jgi:hypothetical protein
MHSEIIWGRFVEKTGGQKFRATVPLSYGRMGFAEHSISRGTDEESLTS